LAKKKSSDISTAAALTAGNTVGYPGFKNTTIIKIPLPTVIVKLPIPTEKGEIQNDFFN